MNDGYSIVYSSEARKDLRDIYVYIASVLRVPKTAERLTEHIRQEIQSLDFMPSRYPLVEWEPWRSMGMYKVPIENFVIYYTVNHDSRAVCVIRIFYGGRSVEKIGNEVPEKL